MQKSIYFAGSAGIKRQILTTGCERGFRGVAWSGATPAKAHTGSRFSFSTGLKGKFAPHHITRVDARPGGRGIAPFPARADAEEASKGKFVGSGQ